MARIRTTSTTVELTNAEYAAIKLAHEILGGIHDELANMEAEDFVTNCGCTDISISDLSSVCDVLEAMVYQCLRKLERAEMRKVFLPSFCLLVVGRHEQFFPCVWQFAQFLFEIFV